MNYNRLGLVGLLLRMANGRYWAISLSFIASALSALLAGGSATIEGAKAETDPQSGDPLILVTGENRSMLDRCGCQPRQGGGISKRATVLRKLREASSGTVILDSGNLLRLGKDDPTRAKLLVSLLRDMRYDAIVAGESEFLDRDASVRTFADQVRMTYLDGLNPGREAEYAIFVRNGVRIAVAKLSHDDDRLVDLGLNGWGTLSQSADVLVIFVPATIQRRSKWADGCPVPLLVVEKIQSEKVRSRINLETAPIERIGNVTYIRPDVFGQPVFALSVEQMGEKVALGIPRIVPVVSDTTPDPKISRAVRDYERAHSVTSHDALPPAIDPVVLSGSKDCSSCHWREHAQWQTTGHAHAWITLESKQSTNIAECVTCHSTPSEIALDIGRYSGVACQSCHGDGSLPGIDGTQFAGLLRRPTEQVCKTCHDAKSDPDFSYKRSLRRVSHRTGN